MKKEDFSLVLGDIRDDFVARAHEPVRPRRAAPNRRRWCAAACLCLVTATAVLLTARYLPLKDYKDGDTNYSPSQPLTNYQIGVEACYKAPDPGEYFCFVEVNACKGGCVNGPAKTKGEETRFKAALDVENYAREDADAYPAVDEEIPMGKRFFDRAHHEKLPDEDTIRSILAKIGKESPEQELNCGACGYNSCREKAIAVYLNKAELTMCVPYMKERAESLSNYVLSETPNITIMVDDEMNIIEFNKAAEECFKISRREALEKGLFELIDSSDFQFVLETKQPITNKKVHYKEYGITTEQSIIYIDKQNIVMGIFKDITKEEREQENLYDLRVETMEMAQKVIDKQMVAAQQIASLLGETTAETKVTLTKLKNMIVFDGDE